MEMKHVVFLFSFIWAVVTFLPGKAQQVVIYRPSSAEILNPERGFYYPILTNAANYVPLKASDLQNYRDSYEPFKGAPFKVQSSLILRIFVLDGFQNMPLTAELLQQIDNDFNAVRQAGMKCIIRFAYNFSPSAGYKPPYKDAPLNMAQQHLQQLAPVFQKNKDVIAIAQMGLIGLWGEGYYTDYYGTPGGTSQQNLKDRAGLLDAYLKALPAPLIVQVRYPTMKQDYLLLMKKPQMKSRIGFHNDAFLSSNDDMGTFKSYDISVNAKASNTKEVLMSYTSNEAGNTAMGGESALANPPYDNCSVKGGQTETQLAQFHYSYMNGTYNPKVLSGWAPCIDDIKRKLGYRFVLEKGTFPSSAQRNAVFHVTINLANEGYAAPFNGKKVELVFSNESGNTQYIALLKDNVKGWTPGKQTIDVNVLVPATVNEGNYKVYLRLADMNASLHNRPEYAIQCANEGTWTPQLAANDLQVTIKISGSNSKAVNSKSVKKLATMR
ncbi:DUF4832 domain-containing protein [Chitinophaga sp. 212800010-3]|uniref:DUF4832 domain-containing protein n=1 Tax=unclassified Chitinophaga TaxID=2619133 RepID=UPI002DE89A1B|nr:DUF4832 domain-containing protein [Chitinophaga sp. 212800010-3]